MGDRAGLLLRVLPLPLCRQQALLRWCLQHLVLLLLRRLQQLMLLFQHLCRPLLLLPPVGTGRSTSAGHQPLLRHLRPGASASSMGAGCALTCRSLLMFMPQCARWRIQLHELWQALYHRPVLH